MCIYVPCCHMQNNKNMCIEILFLSDKVISSEHLIGVPLLVLANKQDVPDCMGVREVKPIFNQSAHLIGRRDCMVMPVSLLMVSKTSAFANLYYEILNKYVSNVYNSTNAFII